MSCRLAWRLSVYCTLWKRLSMRCTAGKAPNRPRTAVKPAGRAGGEPCGLRRAAGWSRRVTDPFTPGKTRRWASALGPEQWEHPGARRVPLPPPHSPGFPARQPAQASRPRPPPKPGPSPMPHEALPLVTLAVAVASFLLYSKRIFTNSPLLSRSGLEVSLPA